MNVARTCTRRVEGWVVGDTGRTGAIASWRVMLSVLSMRRRGAWLSLSVCTADAAQAFHACYAMVEKQ